MKKNKTLILVVGILLAIVVGVSFAYFLVTTNITGEGSNVNLGTGSMPKVEYDTGDRILSKDNLIPKDIISKNFKVTVTPTKDIKEVTYIIYLDITENTFEKCRDDIGGGGILRSGNTNMLESRDLNIGGGGLIGGRNYDEVTNRCEIEANELIYRLKDSNGNVIATDDITEFIGKKEIKLELKSQEVKTEYNYTIEVEFVDTGSDQNHNQNKEFVGNIGVEFGRTPQDKVLAQDFLKGMAERDQFESITTVSNTNIPDNAIKSWDAGERENGNVMAWYTDTDNNGLYELYLGQDGGVVAPEDSCALFSSGDCFGIIGMNAKIFSNVTTINLSNFNTSNVTNMGGMFSEASSLTTLDLSNFNTSNVTNMGNMFFGASSLTTLDLSNFNTSNVTNMGSMFSEANSLTILDLSNFDTSNVTNMDYMFNGASSLTTLDLRKADFSNVSDYYSMLYNSNLLNSIIVKNTTAQDFINARLTDDNITGVNVTIAS